MTSHVNPFRISADNNRDSWAIRAWLYNNGLSMSEVARRIGVSSSLVFRTVMGERNSYRVLHYLAAIGVPPKMLNISNNTVARVES